jgi:NADH-quinone oxidoreductase subunit G
MVEVTIDGHKVEVPPGSMVMHAVEKLGQYVPHFCYHKKLSIAANCRMCLVDVEKAPKPMPACATPVTQGMVVHTASEKAKNAQQGVMELLLINHPLDCPICDQGGECQLQDLAVGYGKSESRYHEEKRVVAHKELGPLISAEEMSRCIHCTRCVRFGQEVAGVMELGMIGRGEHAEITSFLGHTIDSELSGNMIDICPVGALTSKPFRYSARTWELSRRKSISPHDSLGSNLVVQVKNNQVMRVVPLENEAVNECWISDRDRFSYEGLNSPDRLTEPMIKRDGQWHAVSWEEALTTANVGLAAVMSQAGAAGIGARFAANSTLEETFMLNRLVRALGSDNIDFRVRVQDPAQDQYRTGAPWLGMPVSQINRLERILIVGSFLRKDHPLIAARVRDAVKRGAKVSLVHVTDDELLMPLAAKCIVRPSQLARKLAEIAVALARELKLDVPMHFAFVEPTECASMAAKSLASGAANGATSAILLGNLAINDPHASELQAITQWIAQTAGARVGFLTESANTVGAHLLKAHRGAARTNPDAQAMILMNLEPHLDCADAGAFLKPAEFVVALTPYRSAVESVATVMLPVAPFSETPGSFISAEGRLQTFNPVVKPLGQARPAWKVLRMIADGANVSALDFDSIEAVRIAALAQIGNIESGLSNQTRAQMSSPIDLPNGNKKTLEHIVEVPIHSVDMVTRRALALQETADAAAPSARMHADTLAALNLVAGEIATLRGTSGAVQLPIMMDASVPRGAVRIAAAHHSSAVLAAASSVTVEHP